MAISFQGTARAARASLFRARARVRSCAGCKAKLGPTLNVRPGRGDLCDRCNARALRALLRPCRN